ncbi:MAG: PKD domain-containing protein, partial [Planctomycetota bacterium]
MKWSGKIMKNRKYACMSLCGLFVASAYLATAAFAEERKFVVMLAKPIKDMQNPSIVLPNPNDIWDQYFDSVKPNVDSFAEYFNEISYGNVTITGTVSPWIEVPWRVTPQPDGFSSETIPFTNLHYNGFQQFINEEFKENDLMYAVDMNGNTKGGGTDPDDYEYAAIPDGWWTPGERFRDLNGNDKYDGLLEDTADGFGDVDEPGKKEEPEGCIVGVDDPCNPAVDATCKDPNGKIDRALDFCDSDKDGVWDFPEPFEDFLRIWNRNSKKWVKLDPSPNNTDEPNRKWAENYIKNNYPGDADALIARCGNGKYDGPDKWTEKGNTKLKPNDSVDDLLTWEPSWYEGGGGYPDPDPKTATWWEHYWAEIHKDAGIETAPPAPPAPTFSSRIPKMVSFDPTENRKFEPNVGGDTARSGNTPTCYKDSDYPDEDPTKVCVGTVDPLNPGDGSVGGDESGGSGPIYPDATGYYDGPAEFSDLASSIYHARGDISGLYHTEWGYGPGDGRLGEVTSPKNDSAYGQDIGGGSPGNPSGPDGIIPPAGPLATNIHGAGGYDAGNLLNLEYLTWVIQNEHHGYEEPFDDPCYLDDPISCTPLPSTETYAEPYGHPCYWDDPISCTQAYDEPPGDPCYFEDPITCTPSIKYIEPIGDPCYDTVPISCTDSGEVVYVEPEPDPCWLNDPMDCTLRPDVLKRDYNLDGLLDQGEVRDAGTENYVRDPNSWGTNDGGGGEPYPFNRRRLTEDMVEALDAGFDWDNFVMPQWGRNFLYSTILLPDGLFPGGLAAGGRGLFVLPAPGMDLPIQVVEDPGNPLSPIWFSDYAATIDANGLTGQTANADYQTSLMAHEFLHVWEWYPDLYDYDVYDEPPIFENFPIGRWCVMASGGLVHPVPILKESYRGRFNHDPWIQTTDLTTILPPLQQTDVVLTDYAVDPVNSVFYIENTDRVGETFYFYRETHYDYPLISSLINFNKNLPGNGVLILHADNGGNPEAQRPQQRNEPFTYRIIQADGLQQLENGENRGDAGDPFPGTTKTLVWNDTTDPNNRWYGQVKSEIEITNIVHQPDHSVVTFMWSPRLVPQLMFTQPPGGTVTNENYNIQYEAWDLYGSTLIEFFYDTDKKDYNGTSIGTDNKLPGNVIGTFFVNVNSQLAGNDTYFFYAKLVPQPGQGSEGNTDPVFSNPRPGANNTGRGQFLKTLAGELGVTVDTDISKFEVWTVTCIDSTTPDAEQWQVTGSVSGIQADATTGVEYSSDNGEISFVINWLGTAGTGADVSNDGDYLLTDPAASFDGSNIKPNDTVRILTGPLPGIYRILGVQDPNTLRLAVDAGDSEGAADVQYRIHSFTDGTIGGTQADNYLFLTTGLTAYSASVKIEDNQVIPEVFADIVVTYPEAQTNPNNRIPLQVSFDASGSLDEFGQSNPNLTYNWDFGDGTVSNQQIVTHTYITPYPIGVTVTLTVTNPATGVTGTATTQIIVNC